MNFEKYPWLQNLSSNGAKSYISSARKRYAETGAVVFPQFVAPDALQLCVQDARAQADAAFTTDDVHTAYLKEKDLDRWSPKSVYNHNMRTQVASIAFDELAEDSPLAAMYKDIRLRSLISAIVSPEGASEELYLSDDPLGCCSINVFRPGYHHSFHFDESSFSSTIMLQEAEETSTGLFQYTHPLKTCKEDLAMPLVAKTISKYDENSQSVKFDELVDDESMQSTEIPALHTLEFVPGTLSIFAGSRSLHRVTKVEGNHDRLVAVLTFAPEPGFCNSARVQKLFWGRARQPEKVKSRSEQ